MKRIYIVLILFIIFSGVVFSREFFLEPWGCFLDLPQGWEPLEVTDDQATFADTAQKGFLQIKVYPGETWDSAPGIFEDIGNRIKADSEGEEFLFAGKEAAFATYLFAVNDNPYEGFGLLVNGDERDWVILSFSEMEVYEEYQYFLLSALDSFALDSPGLYTPGPVSSYYLSSYEEPDFFQVDFRFEEHDFLLEMDGNAMETAEVIVEREIAVLSRYSPGDKDAWSRFYRMIYRDNYRRIDELFRQLLFKGLRRNNDPADTAGRILAWLQDFRYSRTGTVTDFLPPLSALYNMTGDCDSLGLIYIILLKHYGIDAVLMVSSRYSHAMAAVDVPGEGARFPFGEKEYLVAETTDKVALGMIAASMADPAGWLGISFN